MNMIRFISFASLLLACGLAFAVVETFQFEDDLNREQYHNLTETLRCPKCQNQNIADSNAPIAKDMRKEVYRLVKDGKTDDDVVDYMVDRFGDFVVYKPRMDSSTIVLWFGPLLIGVFGVAFVILLARKNRGNGQADAKQETSLSKDDQDKVKKLLGDS